MEYTQKKSECGWGNRVQRNLENGTKYWKWREKEGALSGIKEGESWRKLQYSFGEKWLLHFNTHMYIKWESNMVYIYFLCGYKMCLQYNKGLNIIFVLVS
jgi:hypothetical protein